MANKFFKKIVFFALSLSLLFLSSCGNKEDVFKQHEKTVHSEDMENIENSNAQEIFNTISESVLLAAEIKLPENKTSFTGEESATENYYTEEPKPTESFEALNDAEAAQITENTNALNETEPPKKSAKLIITWQGRNEWNDEVVEINLRDSYNAEITDNSKGYANDGSLLWKSETSYTENDGKIIFELYDMNGRYNLELGDNKSEAEAYQYNGIFNSMANITFTDVDGNTTKIDDNYCTFRSHTGFYFYGIGIQNGRLTDYDSSWIIDTFSEE